MSIRQVFMIPVAVALFIPANLIYNAGKLIHYTGKILMRVGCFVCDFGIILVSDWE